MAPEAAAAAAVAAAAAAAAAPTPPFAACTGMLVLLPLQVSIGLQQQQQQQQQQQCCSRGQRRQRWPPRGTRTPLALLLDAAAVEPSFCSSSAVTALSMWLAAKQQLHQITRPQRQDPSRGVCGLRSRSSDNTAMLSDGMPEQIQMTTALLPSCPPPVLRRRTHTQPPADFACL
eukprot:TRINITY_DN9869_c1_g1_i1.p1 TRINITY_DN9869_c1_g1~~TRINITY_DN9869_c1_g1_i1.p1  ORF type:complete len:174 (+),score=66.78 TRINITY_DN9869_c1_g1_i1:418-939(+)